MNKDEYICVFIPEIPEQEVVCADCPAIGGTARKKDITFIWDNGILCVDCCCDISRDIHRRPATKEETELFAEVAIQRASEKDRDIFEDLINGKKSLKLF